MGMTSLTVIDMAVCFASMVESPTWDYCLETQYDMACALNIVQPLLDICLLWSICAKISAPLS